MKTNYFLKFMRRGVENDYETTPTRVGHYPDSIVSRLCLASLICLCMLTVGVGNAWGETVTYTFSSKSWTASPANWTSNTDGSSFESSGDARGVANNGVSGACTSPTTFSNVSSISVVASSNTTGGKVAIKIGGTQIADKSIGKSNNTTYTYNSSDYSSIASLSGNVQIVVTKPSSKTVWVKSITITYTTGASVATPTFSVAEGTYNSNQSVTISCATAGSTIYYTTNGTTPTSSSTAYSSAVSISSTTTLKAIAIKSGTSSSVASATYTLKCATPTFSPAAGTYGAVQSVSISTTYGTNIYYTTDGSTPTTSSTLYSSAISVSSSQTIKAIATKTGCSNSEVGSAEYTINIPYTVSFNTGTGNPTVSSRTEASAGAGITLPSGPTPACSSDGWNFAGWGYESCDDESTEPTLYIAGNKYYPESNETLYAVYVKGKTASTNYKLISDAAQIVSGENYVIAAYYNSNDYAITAEIQSSYYIKQTAVTVTENVISSPGAKIIWQLTNEGGSNVSLYNSNQSKYLYVYASSSYRNLGLYGSKKQFTMTEEREAGYASTFAFNSTDYTSYYINYDASHTDFGTKTSSDENLYLYKRQYTGTYESNPTCCTPLGSVTGILGTNTPTSVTLTWSAVSGAEKYQVKVPGSSSHNDWTDAVSGVSVTKSCGTAYTAYFRAIDTNGSHCSEGPESTLAIPAVSWTVTSTGVTHATASPAIPSTTCSGFSTTISAATGYALPADITVTNASKSWDSSTGALTISSVTGDVSITITPTAGSTWKFKYSGDDYDPHIMTEAAGVASYSLSLAADTRYEFGFDDNGSAFYKNQGTIITTTDGWVFNTSDNNCKIHTGPAGTYTFAINTTSKVVTVTYPTVTHPNEHYVYFKNSDVWGTVYGHLYNTGNDNKAAAWPGSVMQATTTICGQTYHYAALNAMSGTYNAIKFNNGSGGYGNETSALSTTGSLGKYNANRDDAWHDFKYTVSYDKGTGGSGSMSSHTELCPGSNQALSANTFTKDHYHFTGWVASADVTINSETVTAGTLITGTPTIQNVQSDITLTAQWEINSNTLTWNWGGGSTSSTTYTLYPATSGSVNYNAAITKPANGTMSKTGYTFSSWSSNATTMPDEDLTIMAQWTAKTTSITLNKNNSDASGSTAGSASWTYDQTTKNSITAATRTGYNVDGYYTAASDGTKILNADGSLAGNSITVDAVVYTSGGKWAYDGTSLTLYAHWTLKTTTVSFNQNSGTGGQTTTKTATYSQAMPTPITTPTRAGYTFTGYFENSGGTGTKYYNADGSSATNWNKENATWTLYAGWTAKEDTYKTALHTGESGWTSYASGVTKSGAGYTIPAPSSVTKGVGSTCEDLHYHFAGWVADDYKGSPSGHIITATGTTDATGTTYWAVWEKEAAGGGGTSSITITRSTTGITATGYGSGVERTWTQSEIDFGGHYIMTNNANTPSGASAQQYIVMQKSNGTLYNTEELPGAITEVQVVQYSALACNVYCGDERLMASDNTSGGQTPSGTLITKPDDATTMTWTISASNNYKFFALKAYTSSSSGTNYITSVKVTYSTITYEDPKAVCEACVATPSISGVSLTGSSFSTTSVPVQATGASAGDNCSLASYGFYWGTSASPTTNNTASDNLSTGAFSATLTGTFTIGTTYYYRAYATNEAPNTGYSSDGTFTLQNVTFNMHSHGGDAPATQVVPQGGKATDPSDPSETGYTFDGWWDNSSYTGSAWDFSTNTVGSGGVTLHAKWTENNYTVTMAQSPSVGATLTGGTTTAHYGGTINISTTVPSGYRFTGWTADPSVTFADASATSTSFSMPASNVTVTANFVQIHTLTFVVPDGGGSAVTPPATADHGGTVTLPGTTGKDAEFSCETFLGWTTTAPNGSGTWSPAPTYKAAGATSDAINTNTTFYAVYSRSGGGASGTVELPCTVIATWKSDTLGGTSNAYGTVTSVRINNLTWTTTGNIDDAGEVKIKTGYYLKIPTLPGNISTIRMVVSQQNESNACAEYPGNATTKEFYFRSAADGSNLFSSETTSSRSRTITITSGDYTTGYICCTDGTGNIHSVSVDYGPAPIISHTLKCDCAITQFDLTYDANTSYFPGSTTSCSGVDDYKWSEHDDVYTICSTEPTLSGYKFTGWTTSANGSGDHYDAGQEISCVPTADVTLYAQYERVYTVNFYDQGNLVSSPTQASAGASVKVPNHTTPCTDEEHEPDEYTWAFAGWSTTPSLSNSLTPNLVLNATTGAYNADYTPTDDITLYAVYQKTTTTSPTFQNGKTGAYNLSAVNGSGSYVGQTCYPTSKYASGYYCGTVAPVPQLVVYFTYQEAGTYAGLYTIQSSDGYYASATSTASSFSWKSTPDATCYLKATSVTGGFQFEWWNGGATGSYFTHDSRFGQFRSAGDPLIMTPAAGSTYFTTMTCSSTFDMTFSMSSGVIDYGAGSSADYLNKADGTVISTFPTATLDGWTFIGWTAGSQYNSLYDVSGYYSDQNSSNTDPIASPAVGGAIYGGSYGGTAYTMHSDIVMYPVFTKFEDNVAFDEINGGDYYIYFLDENREDTYGAYKRVYATSYDGEKRYSSTASCARATLFTFTKLPNGNWTIQDKTTGNYLYGIADDDLKQKSETSGAEWTLTLNGSQFDAFHVGTTYGQLIANGNGTSATFMNYRRTNIADNPSVYHRVYLGSCAERIFSSNPTNTPEITLNGEAGIITSSQNGAIRGTNVLSVSGSQLTADITISSNSSDIYFSTSASSSFALAAAYQPKTEITIVKNGSGIVNPTTVYVHYKPSSNTDTWTTKTITASSTGADDQTKDVNLRIVQENFVIASKVGDTWYALPADMSSAGVYEPVLIEVDESNKVAYGPSTVAYKMWPVQTVNGGTDRYADYGNRVRFAGNSNKGLMTSSANNNIQNNAAITAIGSTAATPATYEWTLSTADRETYTLYNDNGSRYLDIYRPTSGGNAGKLIWAGNDTYETNEVHFFPLEERTTISIIPREWKSNGLVFAIDADNNISLTADHTTAKIGTGDAASATLTRHSTGGYGLYEVALPALASHYGKVLTLKMKIGGVDTYAYTTIPIIVTGTTTTTTAETPFTALDAASKDYDVVILDGAKLTTNATASHASKFQNFYVYSGGTWINNNGSTSFNYLELRGGIKGIGAKDSHVQGVPHVMLNKGVTSTAGANLDMTVYTDHGYALSVPFDVDLSKVNFANSLKPGTGAQVNGTLASQFWIRKYDGAVRAANGKGGWVDLEPEEVDEVMVYPTIHAGEGYTLQGKRPKGQPFAVIRFPFSGVGSWANASGEVAKADIPIYAHAGGANTPDNDKGWNLIANPYMATIAYNTDDELSWAAAFKVGSLTETEGAQWDGKYQWENADHAYVTIPNDSYTAFPQTRASKATFYPFKNFFIQAASNGVVAFVRADRSEMPRHLMAQEEQITPIYADINLAHGGESAQAGLTIDADATTGYKFGEDYTIFESREALDYLKVYTIADGHYLVGNMLTPEETAELIPLEFYAPSAEGEYVFSLDDGSDIERLEYVILYDAELGLNTNLLTDDYTVALTETGLVENRFSIGLKIKEKDETATGINNTGGDGERPLKFIYHEKMYILQNGVIYDATGKKVREINK